MCDFQTLQLVLALMAGKFGSAEPFYNHPWKREDREAANPFVILNEATPIRRNIRPGWSQIR